MERPGGDDDVVSRVGESERTRFADSAAGTRNEGDGRRTGQRGHGSRVPGF